MAVQAGINSTTANDAVNASQVAQFIIEGPRAIPIYEALAMQYPVAPGTGNVISIPSWDASPATETTTQGDEVVSADYTTSAKTATGIMVSTRGLITDQWVMDSGALASSGVDEMSANVRNAIDVAVLALFNTATNKSDNTGNPLTLALWLAALAAFKAQLPGQQAIAYVGSSGQMRDFHAALIANAGSAQIMGAGNSIFDAQVIDGYLGLYHGIHMFESANVAAADADNDCGGFVALSAGQPGSSPVRSGLCLAVWRGIEARGLYTPHRHGLDVTTSARVGFSRTVERCVRGLISTD